MERLFGRSKVKKSSSSNNSPTVPASVTGEDEGFSLVTTPPPIVEPPVQKPAYQQQQSICRSYLDGVPFVLNTKVCSTSSNDLDQILARIEGLSERVKSVDWTATDYDFRLERSVVEQDISATLRRLHAN